MRIMNVDYMGCLHWHWHANEEQISYKFLRTLKEIIEQFQIDRTFLLLEGGSSYRAGLHPEYKSARKQRREEMSDQEKREYRRFTDETDLFVKQVAPQFALVPIRVRGAEADDLAGYLCNHIDTKQHQIFNLSGDQDWYQLLRKNVVQGSYSEIKNEQKGGWQIPASIWLSESKFVRKYEIPVRNWIWKKCLSGDTGDSVPGFPSMGDGTALALLKEYGGIEEIEQNLETVHVPRMRQAAKDAMRANFDLVRQNYQIMNLNFSAVEEQAIFGQNGIASLQQVIAGLTAGKSCGMTAALQELCFERGWLAVDDDFMAPFLR